MSENTPSTELQLHHVMDLNRTRLDRWSQLRRLAARLEAAHASGKDAARLGKEIGSKVAELSAIEGYWAFPGPALMGKVNKCLDDGQFEAGARLIDTIARNLKDETYRRDPRVWELRNDPDEELPSVVDPMLSTQTARPYFEVLVVSHSPQLSEEAQRRDRHALRREDDPFLYETVRVGSYADAVVAALVNGHIQAVVIEEGFPFASQAGLSTLEEFLRQVVDVQASELDADDYALSLADAIHRIRPELDIYVTTDRAVEELARARNARHIRRIFYGLEEVMELHLSILAGVEQRYDTPFFSNLKAYAKRPVGTFHALPVARGKSVFGSHWIRDMGHFYGTNLFLAESSATTGGLDSLLEPTGNIKKAQEQAARCFGADRTYFVTNGTSTANKIVVQGVCQPGDIVLVDRNCHKSHHYGMVLCGAQPLYLDAFPLREYSMYGGVPLSLIKRTLLQLKAEGKLDRVRMLLLTNCTFDGHVYNTRRVMEECLAIKPDLIFLWDEAWFAYARFSPFLRPRTGMGAAAFLAERYAKAGYRKEYEDFRREVGEISLDNPKALERRLMPDPEQVRLRVYATQSTHKSLSALRQASMIHVKDQDFAELVRAPFEESFLTHTSTSPSQQLLASLDVARRQAELEGYELVTRQLDLAIRLRQELRADPRISRQFSFLTPAQMIPAEYRGSGFEDYAGPDLWRRALDAVREDEFFLDPSRLTLACGLAGYDGTQFKLELADKWDIQLNKTSRNTVLLQSNINNTRSSSAYLIETLGRIAEVTEERQRSASESERAAFQRRVRSLVEDVPDLPDFSHFHDAFRDSAQSATREGRMREAFFLAYRGQDCEYLSLKGEDIDRRLREGPELVSANFVIPYPPGFPIMVPGQVITPEIIAFMRALDVKEIHGYHADVGLKLLRPDRLAVDRRPGSERPKGASAS